MFEIKHCGLECSMKPHFQIQCFHYINSLEMQPSVFTVINVESPIDNLSKYN